MKINCCWSNIKKFKMFFSEYPEACPRGTSEMKARGKQIG